MTQNLSLSHPSKPCILFTLSLLITSDLQWKFTTSLLWQVNMDNLIECFYNWTLLYSQHYFSLIRWDVDLNWFFIFIYLPFFLSYADSTKSRIIVCIGACQTSVMLNWPQLWRTVDWVTWSWQALEEETDGFYHGTSVNASILIVWVVHSLSVWCIEMNKAHSTKEVLFRSHGS